MTMTDIENLRINQLEELLIGMGENAEKVEEMMKNGGKSVEVLEGDAAIKALLGE